MSRVQQMHVTVIEFGCTAFCFCFAFEDVPRGTELRSGEVDNSSVLTPVLGWTM